MSLVFFEERGNAVTLSDNNLTIAIVATLDATRANLGKSTGKWYWETTMLSSGIIVGIDDGTETLSSHGTLNGNNKLRGYFSNTKVGTVRESYGSAINTNDVISVLLDLDNGTLEFWNNGVSQGVAFTDIKNMTMPIYPRISVTGSNGTKRCTVNFGATPFVYEIPKDFKAYDYDSSIHWSREQKILLKSNNKIYSLQSNELAHLPSDSVDKFIKYGTPSIEHFNLIQINKNYILSKNESENTDGLWEQDINRKPLTIKFE